MGESSVEMSQELAQRLMAEGSTCICLGVPPGTEFGIDMKSWNTAEKFLGVKMIPSGFHYIHYSMNNIHGDLAPRAGFVWFTKKSEVRVKKWDEKEGLFSDEPNEVAEKVRENIKDLDRNLGVYPFDVREKWQLLTNKITESLAKKFVPVSGTISSVLELNGTSDNDRKSESLQPTPPRRRQRCSAPFSDVDQYGDMLPSLHATDGTELRLSRFPEKAYPPGSNAAEITHHSLDSSYLLGQILAQHDKPHDILGELQFAFVSFLVGHSMEGFEQWKRLLGVLSSVQKDLSSYASLFSELLTLLKPQLEEIPQDFLVDIVASSNFVYQSLRNLFRNIDSDSDNARLKVKANRLKEFLTQTFMWNFTDIDEEDEDEQPVIVIT